MLSGTPSEVHSATALADLTPEQRHLLSLAFEQTLRRLNLVDRNDPICEIDARKIVEIAANDATNAVAIAGIAVRQLGPDR
ncbi:hypothetical protein JQ615_30935 [Bradyrhizobium jicamae]|uniref:Uncharacterized protein n=1 Tax=Bradyrhizobium jicamae TaxID=280332 RepID=A0ABS5FSS6_9BRAD|nr:hypothetical protein [Bradyrhizobium jicamae]MBR0799796.1 hypothetical protein [Bradyrhizobium jicamae]MBR0939434.1 hypothetical protein [Bradyrhizobium jicamae]